MRQAGSVAKFGFSSKIEKLGTINSMTYRIQNSSKTNFATEPNLPHVLCQAAKARKIIGLRTVGELEGFRDCFFEVIFE